jgi:nucleotide-binding universal stress UspA family protein
LKAAELLAGNYGIVSKSIVSSQPWADAVLQNATVFQPDLVIISDDLSLNHRPTTADIIQIIDSAKCSVLVARTTGSSPESSTAVFATDHSPFCLRCIRSLLRLLPTGITNIRIVSALEEAAETASTAATKALIKRRPRLSERTLLELNRALVEHLESYGFQADAQLYMGSPQEAIDTMTKKVNPDFLIICAQGAGFAPDKGIGELVKNQLLNTTGSVLVLQP